MAYIVMAYIVVAYIVMAYIVMARYNVTSPPYPHIAQFHFAHTVLKPECPPIERAALRLESPSANFGFHGSWAGVPTVQCRWGHNYIMPMGS